MPSVLDIAVESFGYLASALVFFAFYMRTMLPLRCVAIASNVAFLVYGVWFELWPVAVLHVLLLPLNTLRLMQTRRMLTGIRAARTGTIPLDAIARSFTPLRYTQGTTLFRKGEIGDCAYYLAQGRIFFPEVGASCDAGQLFGEIALFSPSQIRTASAVCLSDVEVYRIDENAIVVAFHQTPAFAFALMRLVTQRLLSNFERVEAGFA